MDEPRTDREGGGSVGALPNHWRFRFSLKALLFFMTIIAMFGLGYSAGYHSGRAKTRRERLLDEMRTTNSENNFPTHFDVPMPRL